LGGPHSPTRLACSGLCNLKVNYLLCLSSIKLRNTAELSIYGL